jgi:trigger factor
VDIKITKDTNNLDAVLSINIQLADLEEEANKSLQQAKHKLNLPGFRPGMIPKDVAKKYLWDSIIRQELEKILEKTIEEYFKSNEIEIIRPLLPILSEKEIDFKKDTEFEFKYNLGLVDDISYDPNELLKSHKIHSAKITKKDIEEEIELIRNTYGNHTHPEEIEDNENVSVTLMFSELDSNNDILEGGIKQKVHKKITELPKSLKDILIGKKQKEDLHVKIKDLIPEASVLANLLSIEKLTVEDLGNDFMINIQSIHKEELAELNEELFDKATQGKAQNIEEFKAEVENMLNAMYDRQANSLLSDEIMKTMLEKIDMKMPQKFLDLLFDEEFAEKKKDFNAEELKLQRSEFEKKIKWSLIIHDYAKKQNIVVNEQEIIEEAYMFISATFYQYGLPQMDQDKMTAYLDSYLQKQENVHYIKERLMVKKMFETIKSGISFEKKELTLDKFKKLISQLQ